MVSWCSCLQYLSKVFVVFIFTNICKIYLHVSPFVSRLTSLSMSSSFPSSRLFRASMTRVWSLYTGTMLKRKFSSSMGRLYLRAWFCSAPMRHMNQLLIEQRCFKWHLKNPVYISLDFTYFPGIIQVLMQTCFLPVRNPWGKKNPEIQKDLGWPLVIQLCSHNHTHTHTSINGYKTVKKVSSKVKLTILDHFYFRSLKKKKSRLYVMDTTTYISLTKTLKSYCLERISG